MIYIKNIVRIIAYELNEFIIGGINVAFQTVP